LIAPCKLAGLALVPLPVPFTVAYITAQLCGGGGAAVFTCEQTVSLGQLLTSVTYTQYWVEEEGDATGEAQLEQLRLVVGFQ
jgi:hypothetical protein